MSNQKSASMDPGWAEALCKVLAERVAQNYKIEPVADCSDKVILFVIFKLRKDGRITDVGGARKTGTQVKLPKDHEKSLLKQLEKAVSQTEPFMFLQNECFNCSWYRVQVELRPFDNQITAWVVDP